MQKVLVVNKGASDNLGDQAILKSIRNSIREATQHSVVFKDFTTIMSEIPNINKDKQTFKNSKIKIFIRIIAPLKLIWILRKFNKIRSVFKKEKPDYVVIGGGQLILNNDYFPIALFLWSMFCKAFKRKLIITNVGVSEEFNLIDKALINFALKNSVSVSVRDERSYRNLLINFGVEAVLSGDIVFTDSFKTCEKVPGSTLLSIPGLYVYNTYNPVTSRVAYFEKWLKFIEKSPCDINKCKLVYTTNNDYHESLLFKDYVKSKLNIDMDVYSYDSLEDFEKITEFSEYIISGRMHALILGLNSQCKVFTFPISNKLKQFSLIVENNNIKEYKENIKDTTYTFLRDNLR